MKDQRWYDNDDKLSRCIEGLRYVPSFERYRLVQGMMCLIKEYQDDLLDRFVLDFPLEPNRCQWYDSDPYLWLVINGVQYGTPQLQHQVTAYLAEELEEQATVYLRISIIRAS